MSKRISLALLSALSTLAPVFLPADSPLPPPKKAETWSSDKSHVVVSDPETNKTTIFAATKDRRIKLWDLNGWHRYLFIARDAHALML